MGLHQEGLTWCSGVLASLALPECPGWGRFGGAAQSTKHTFCIQVSVTLQLYEQTHEPVHATSRSSK